MSKSKLQARYEDDEVPPKVVSASTTEADTLVRVPNKQPTLNGPLRIAVIGDAPGADEVDAGQPFVGYSGSLLKAVMAKVGINYETCYVGNVSQYRPPANKIELFDWHGPQIQAGLTTLRDEITAYNPHLVLLLGGTALRAAVGEKRSIDEWRGSLFTAASDSPFAGRKCLATYHPSACLRVWSQTAILRFDLRRAAEEGATPELVLPNRALIVPGPSETPLDYLHKVLEMLSDIVRLKQKVSIDIEGYVDRIDCISFAPSADAAFIVPFLDASGGSYWPDEGSESLVWRAVSTVLADPGVPKVLQNCLYDNFVLSYSYKTPIINICDDTMLKHWELFSEMEKSLAFQMSIYTKEPYYKFERKAHGIHQRWRYCCKDSAGTYEVNNVLETQLMQRSEAVQHYNFNMNLLRPLLYMELKGFRYDSALAAQKVVEVRNEMYELQHKLNLVSGKDLPERGSPELFNLIRQTICYKKAVVYTPDDLPGSVLKPYQGVVHRITALLKKGAGMTDAEYGELTTLAKIHLNVDSSDDMADFLYRMCKYPIQFKKEKGRKTNKETTDVLALLNLLKLQQQPNTILAILRLRNLATQLETLTAKVDPDGRIRCGYNAVGSETGRLTCYQSPTGSGFNLQTVTKKHRILFQADPGYDMGQLDLSGADGWTVAAWCAALGDPTMIEDYRYGLKPAKILMLMYLQGAEISRKSREELKALCKELETDGWLYMACKRVQHGSNYGMKEATMSDQILRDSYKYPPHKPVYVEPKVCAALQRLYLIRYRGVTQYQRKIQADIMQKGYLESASGHRRIIFGRKEEHSTFQSALSNEPQENTTYANNIAAVKLWNDPENRRSDGSLIIEPLHQVHDALIVQWPQDVRPWARVKLKTYYDNPIRIAGITITIPFEGGYGPSWGELKEAI